MLSHGIKYTARIGQFSIIDNTEEALAIKQLDLTVYYQISTIIHANYNICYRELVYIFRRLNFITRSLQI